MTCLGVNCGDGCLGSLGSRPAQRRLTWNDYFKGVLLLHVKLRNIWTPITNISGSKYNVRGQSDVGMPFCLGFSSIRFSA